MVSDNADRSRHFPAIEAKYGKPMSFWHREMKKIAGKKYVEQIAHLRETHGFSQAHANALVMYSRGSTTTRQFNSVDDYLAKFDATTGKTVRAILKAAVAKCPKAEIVIAWNQPMLRLGKQYIFGVAAQKKHILLLPLGANAIDRLGGKLKDLKANKKTIQVPSDWNVDEKLVASMVKMRLDDLAD